MISGPSTVRAIRVTGSGSGLPPVTRDKAWADSGSPSHRQALSWQGAFKLW